MQKDKINVVMIGIGHAHAAGVMYELLAQKETFTVLGYVENDSNVLNDKKGSAPFNLVKMLPEEDVWDKKKYQVDAVVVETKMAQLVSTARKYLAMEVPIHLDKPTGWDNDFLDLLSEAEREYIPIQLGYMYRYNPAVCITDNYIKEGKIGTICQIDAFMDTELSKYERSTLAQYPGGAMYVYGCHMLDIVLRWMGKPQAVHSFIKQCGFDGKQYDDSTMAVLEYERGTAVVRANCADANGYGRRQIVLVGEKGTIEIKPIEDPDNPPRMNYAARDGENAYHYKATEIDLSKFDRNRRYRCMIEDYARMIRNETNQMIFPMDYDYEKELHKLLLQVVNVKI